jgi:hypothetical protein
MGVFLAYDYMLIVTAEVCSAGVILVILSM